jgi:hypothetical protein
MSTVELPQRLFGTLTLELCFPCQGIWFDRYESGQITPGGVIELFKLIHARRDDPRRQHSSLKHCPRCHEPLMAGLDRSRSGRFTYHRCLQNHGRFTAFAQFMIEKGFVRELAPIEIKALSARIGTVHCTGCGAPVDIRTESACSHCCSPISILDPDAVEKALADYQKKEISRTTLDPEALADAILAVERQRRPLVPDSAPLVGDLFLSGVGMVLDLLR